MEILNKSVESESDLVTQISNLFEQITGSQIAGDNNIKHVTSKLTKRMRELDLETPAQYWNYIKANEDKEVPRLISLLTTHHTFFFREFPQFEYLLTTALPQLINQMKKEGRKHIKVWSAGCSRGQEVYSLSMFLQFHLSKVAPDFTYDILGTDICAESISIAKNGVYHWDELKEIPSLYLEGNWIKGKGSVADYAKVQPNIKSPCTFQVANLKNISQAIGKITFDLIFCRNVFIYFIPQRVQSITTEMLAHLHPNGFLFLGMTENLLGLELPLTSMGSSVFRHSSAPMMEKDLTIQASRNLKVLCVDDSSTVLKLLKHVLAHSFGFDVVGTASNGVEAKEFLKNNKVDVVTLDIHMPVQNGVEYLKANFNKNHPPVVIVSTVAREDADLAHQALELGASDYIEKPALDGLVKRGDEIRAKIKVAYEKSKQQIVSTGTRFDSGFQKSLKLHDVNEKLRVVIAGAAETNEAISIVGQLNGDQPPLVLLLREPTNIVVPFIEKLKKTRSQIQDLASSHYTFKPGYVYVGDFAGHFEGLKDKYSEWQVSLMVLEMPSMEEIDELKSWPDAQVIVKDIVGFNSPEGKALRKIAHEIVPHTSFLYASDTYFSRDFVKENLKHVVPIKLLEPTVFVHNEVVKIEVEGEAAVCIYHTRRSVGGVITIPDDILRQDSLLLEQSLMKLAAQMGSHGDNLKAKIFGSTTILKKIAEILTELKISVILSKEVNSQPLTAFFFTDSGRLRLPKSATQPEPAAQTFIPSKAAPSTAKGKIKVLIVDDSKVIRTMLSRMIAEDDMLEVVGEADRPSLVPGLIEKLRPDVMTLDIQMPEMSGVDLLRTVIPRYGTAVIMLSSINIEEGKQVIDAMELGAFDYVQKPQYDQISQMAPFLREKIKAAAFFKPRVRLAAPEGQKALAAETVDEKMLIAIGASTGGTAAIKTILSSLPGKVPAIVIAQHIPPVFSKAFAERLRTFCKFEVKEASNGDLVVPGKALVAPGGMQMEVVKTASGLAVKIFDAGNSQLHKPSVDVLFHSVAATAGARSVGVLLTGMGRDGAEGMLKMKQLGAHTIAQDKDSCSVFGMPKAAIDLGAAEQVVPLDQIAECVFNLVSNTKKVA